MDAGESVRRKVNFTAAGATDIGGSRENQDDMFVWERPGAEEPVYVVGVLDGHGREVGRVAAQAARVAFISYFDENYRKLFSDPVECLHHSFVHAHAAIKKEFCAHYERIGAQVTESEEGFLMKRKSSSQPWSCVHGGSSCSIIAIVGNTLYSANVGDSTVTLCTGTPIPVGGVMQDVVDIGLTSLPGAASPPATEPTAARESTERSNTVLVTAEHSPESPEEFYRMRRFRCRETDSMQTALHVVYDSPSVEKVLCPPVFFVDGEATATVTNRGRYYKNVRNEWASLVATPPTAQFQDALAFTRSLGDFHLQTYGVTHLPMIRRMDISQLFATLEQEALARFPVTASVAPMTCATMACLVVATDGIWDNWAYEDVTKFVMDDSCTKAVLKSANGKMGQASPVQAEASPDGGASAPSPAMSGTQRVANSLIKRNAVFAKRNFGGDADNATAVVVYLTCEREGAPLAGAVSP